MKLQHNVTPVGVYLYDVHSRFCELSILCKGLNFSKLFCFSTASTKAYAFYCTGKDMAQCIHFHCVFFTCCLLQKNVKVSTFSLCGMHWCVAKFLYSGYICHNTTEAGKSVCRGEKLWLMAGILNFSLPCKVQYTYKMNSVICLPSKSEAFSIQSWSFTLI
jgi:hypothetical protein